MVDEKVNIMIVGQVRGFFKHIMEEMPEEIIFTGQGNTYEVATNHKNLIAKLLRTKLIGFWGLFKVGKVVNIGKDVDLYLSFNRFILSDKPYIIYLENPTALCNYSLTCIDSPFAHRKLEKYLNDPRLKKIVCMSKACEATLQKVLKVRVPVEKVCQIYPYVPSNQLVSHVLISQRSNTKPLKLLYIAQGSRFISKGGLEIIEAVSRLKSSIDIELTIITNIDQIENEWKRKIITNNIDLLEFKFSYDELERVYAEHHILLQPSSDDSFGLTVLEAMKAGLAVISSDLYAFKEMIKDDYNGYLISPSYYFFDKNDIPNPEVWNKREKTIYSGKVNEKMIEELIERIQILYKDRDKLKRFSINSFNISNDAFGKAVIMNKWNKLIGELND